MSMTEGNTFRIDTPDGRRWRAEVFGPGQRVKVTDIDSPTGYHEYVPPEAVGVTFHVGEIANPTEVK